MDSNRLKCGQINLLSVHVDIVCECCANTPDYSDKLVDVVAVSAGEIVATPVHMYEQLEKKLDKLSSKGWKHEAGKFYCPDCSSTNAE